MPVFVSGKGSPEILAQTMSPSTKLVLGVVQPGAKVATAGPSLTVKRGGFPIIEDSGGVPLSMLGFHKPTFVLPSGRENRKNCGFCVIKLGSVVVPFGPVQFTL